MFECICVCESVCVCVSVCGCFVAQQPNRENFLTFFFKLSLQAFKILSLNNRQYFLLFFSKAAQWLDAHRSGHLLRLGRNLIFLAAIKESFMIRCPKTKNDLLNYSTEHLFLFNKLSGEVIMSYFFGCYYKLLSWIFKSRCCRFWERST